MYYFRRMEHWGGRNFCLHRELVLRLPKVTTRAVPAYSSPAASISKYN